MEFENINLYAGSPLIAEYDDYAAECESALEMTMTRITIMRRSLSRISERNPFDRIESRVKTFESTIKKCQRRGYNQTIESIKANVCDIAGIRIITKYRDEIRIVQNFIEHIPGVNVVHRKDYIEKPKANGYSSLHLGCQVEIYTPDGGKLIPVEIQIRSKSMNLWASIEHDIKYKNDNPDPRVEGYFKKIAGLLEEFDRVSMELRDYSETTEQVADANSKAAAITEDGCSALRNC